MLSAVMLNVSGSTSANTGSAPWATIGMIEPWSVIGLVITSSCQPTPTAARAVWIAAVPLEAATAWGRPKYSANSPSRAAASAPNERHITPEFTTRSRACCSR